MSPAVLDKILSKLPSQDDDRLLVGFSNKDDAAVFQLSENTALVQTADFFTPIVDDPYRFGQIAAANALSDVYAMGGTPQTALTLVCYPEDGDHEVLAQILSGGMDKMKEAQCIVAGGHTIRDNDIKFGYSVTGIVHPQKFWSNDGALPGDILFLTKPIGTGVIATAIRACAAKKDWIDAATENMICLNRNAVSALIPLNHTVHAATDITGFGFLGHAWEMACASGVGLRIDHTKFSFIEGALDCVRKGFIPGGLKKNLEFIADCAQFSDQVDEETRQLLFDPQTSGGLLLAIDPEFADPVHDLLSSKNGISLRIGQVVEKASAMLEVV